MYLKLLFVTLNLNHMYQLYQVLHLHQSTDVYLTCITINQQIKSTTNQELPVVPSILVESAREKEIYIYNNQISIALSLKSSFAEIRPMYKKNQEPLVVPSILEESAKEKDVYI